MTDVDFTESMTANDCRHLHRLLVFAQHPHMDDATLTKADANTTMQNDANPAWNP